MLSIQQVSKQFGRFTALEEIDLQFENGVYGLLAPNGAGKTTLIKMLVTLLFPTKGEILFKGENIVAMDERYRQLLGYLPQQFGYYRHYSPRQYLMYIAALKGIDVKVAKEKTKQLLTLVGLEEVADKKMRKFSGGMLQRTGIAQAMLNDPQILILDEPTAGLDPKERARFRNLLAELARDRIVILSTHIVSDVESVANEIIMIKDKRILCRDTVQGICARVADRVYESYLDYEQLDQLRKRQLVVSEKQEGSLVRVRFLALYPEEMDSSWQAVSPGLEDVFLYEYREDAGEGV